MQEIVSETRMYLENFIQELIIEFIFRNGNESRHQINSNFIVNNEIEIMKRNTKPADVTLYISEETENQDDSIVPATVKVVRAQGGCLGTKSR